MFDTHEATYHLNDSNSIIWIQCNQIRDEVIGIQSGNMVKWSIGNPWVFALNKSIEDVDVFIVLQELNTTYAERLLKWIEKPEKNWETEAEEQTPDLTAQVEYIAEQKEDIAA